MQIWCHPSANSPTIKDAQESGFTWDDDVQGFKGTVEMSVMEGFSRFIGHQGLSLERYQVRPRSPPPSSSVLRVVEGLILRGRCMQG